VSGCKNEMPDKEDIIVQVYDDFFTKEDLLDRMPTYTSSEDSAKLADQIINNWIEQKVVLNFSEQNLTDAQKDFSDQLESYRQNLLIYEYERELVKQKLDTIISETELLSYYAENIENFKLRGHIVKIRFIKLSVDAPKISQVEDWFLSDDEEDLDLLDQYCMKYAETFALEGDVWWYLQDVLGQIPFPINDWDEFLPTTEFYKFEYESFQYLVRIFDYKFRGDISPLSIEQERIRELILNRRKLELINQMREDVVKKARSSNKIKMSRSEEL
jgi:hypothetical protein